MDMSSQHNFSQSHGQRSNLHKPGARRGLIISLLGVAALVIPSLPGYAQTAAPSTSAAPVAAVSAPATSPSPRMVAMAKHRVEMRDKRIAEMQKRLDLTPAEQGLWAPVAQVMRDNGAAYDAVIMNIPRGKMSAVDHLKAFKAMADEHAAGLARLITPFSALYDGLDAKQKVMADELFERRGRNHQ